MTVVWSFSQGDQVHQANAQRKTKSLYTVSESTVVFEQVLPDISPDVDEVAGNKGENIDLNGLTDSS